MERPGLHPRNPHRTAYDFPKLILSCPALGPFVSANRYGQLSIDFADPAAVLIFNRAILSAQYQINDWKVPSGFLCPPIPGRADYIHYLADLLASDYYGQVPRGPKVTVCDIGIGASAIYPIIGQREYNWSFVGTDCEPAALASAQRILKSNAGLEAHIQLRHQPQANKIFVGIVGRNERFDVSMSNPPFHASAAEASGETQRKWRNLGKAEHQNSHRPHLNFGGLQKELWCEGGEQSFIGCIMTESAQQKDLCLWFTTLVSKEKHLPRLQQILESYPVFEYRIIDMVHGQKQSRILAWTFLDERQRAERCKNRWG